MVWDMRQLSFRLELLLYHSEGTFRRQLVIVLGQYLLDISFGLADCPLGVDCRGAGHVVWRWRGEDSLAGTFRRLSDCFFPLFVRHCGRGDVSVGSVQVAHWCSRRDGKDARG